MRTSLDDIRGRTFDVAVIGAGINGASAAQHLASEGYSVLIVDAGDYASGSTSRSSRLLHCGLRYLAPGRSMWDFVIRPDRLAIALRMAKHGIDARSQMVKTTQQRTRQMTFGFPIYRDGPYAKWQTDIAFKLLWWLGPRDLPLDYVFERPERVRDLPLLKWLRDDGQLSGVAQFREYRMDWPERLCVDSVMDAARMGAVTRNYTRAAIGQRDHEGYWSVSLTDTLEGDAATCRARIVMNMAGVWIDEVVSQAKPGARRYITGTKGTHIMVKLPDDCAMQGVAALNRVNEPIYCVPWRGMHFIGPTETLYEGNIDDVRPDEDDIAFLLAETEYLLPGMKLKREDVRFAWAGVRPLTASPREPNGQRSRVVHDLSDQGLPNVLAMTGGVIMTNRSGGAEMAEAAKSRARPSGAKRTISYATRSPEEIPSFGNDPLTISPEHIRAVVEAEHPGTLYDLMFARLGIGWSSDMGYAAAPRVAEAAAPAMGWSPDDVNREVAAYRKALVERHLLREDLR